jgi:hypothetical protein
VAAAYGHRATRGTESGTGGRPERLLDGAATASTASV